MDFKRYFNTFNGAILENRYQRVVQGVLAVAVLLLSIAVLTKDRTVVVVPAGMDMPGEVSNSAADESLQASWGLFLTSLLANVTPKSAPALGDTVKRFLHPSIYREIAAVIDEEARRLEQEQISLFFSPTNARYEPAIRAVVVTGEVTIRGARGTERREIRSYLMRFTVQQHNVLLSGLRVMDGVWKPGDGGIQ